MPEELTAVWGLAESSKLWGGWMLCVKKNLIDLAKSLILVQTPIVFKTMHGGEVN